MPAVGIRTGMDVTASTFPANTARPPLERMRLASRLLVAAYVVLAVVYLGWRATTMNPEAPVFSRVVYGAELFGFATTLLHFFMTWRLTVRVAPPPAAGLTVDIFIPTLNESVDIVRRTLLAARNIDYPHATWLLDDGDRPEMAQLAAQLGVRYVARRDNLHAKAGNLNNALRLSTAEFVAIFDADHAPKRNCLDETLGFFRDPKMAFVQTPQDFFNLDSYQHRRKRGDRRVWTEQSLFFRVIQRGKDAWNAAFFCGSCAVLRRSALDRVGGFATRTVTEDLETSVALHKAGFHSAYVPKALAFGIAPATAHPFLGQRIRWGQGAMQVIRNEWFFLRGGLTLPQRLNYMASAITYFDGWQKAIFYLAPVWVLATGTMPLVADTVTFLALFVPYFVLTFVVFEEVGRGYGRSALIEQYNMARFAAFIWATLGLLRRNLRFRVTRKDEDAALHAETRLMAPQLLVAVLNVMAIVLGLFLWSRFRHLPVEGLVANVVWATVNFGMAYLVLRFTFARTAYRRRDYRFPLPLPALVEVGGHSVTMTVDDVSPGGCRLYGPLPDASVAIGTPLRGALLLPGEQVPFQARVASHIPGEKDGEQYTKAVGIEFLWDGAAERDRLELFLYGSDLQWQINGMDDRVRTPVEALSARPAQEGGKAPVEHWNAVHLDGPAQQAEPCLLSQPHQDGTRWVMASYRRLDTQGEMRVHGVTRRGPRELRLRPLAGLARIATPTGDLYLTEMETC